ncbi:tRNA (uridine(54)-C5)-methyltransferase TrmA [Helicobacter pametensis]|uniref:tRNA (uridine(54)-C5)-methyltransferase TrmA n=1 Tax=Helicobacter pametensis TaxID=95149 RepID=UPI000484045C|nr:tRNA (uridine(54)-C5)-methyltransferase TrmA [Helicobacter pametensis]
MKCEHWGVCGGCSLPIDYQDQLALKIRAFQNLDLPQYQEIATSPVNGYRSRGEFRIFRDEHGLHLAMFASKKPIIIQNCPILLPSLQRVLSSLMEDLNLCPEFAQKLFGVEIMGGVNDECLLTLIYHRRLDEVWEEGARGLAQRLGVQIIGRSRGQKILLGEDGLRDEVNAGGQTYHFLRYDNGFSQPNPYVNAKMIEFALSCVGEDAKDLLELYCGGGNFTIPLSHKFEKVFATEVAKSSIKALHQNLELNGIKNVFCARLSGEESIEALSLKREFNRLRGVDLGDYHFTHLLIDPPRSGVGDKKMLEFMGQYEHIIYISCNPLSLKQDLEILGKTHRISKITLFDQFPYTHHLECGVYLVKHSF